MEEVGRLGMNIVKLITAIWSAPRTDQARLIIALTPELDEPENRHNRCLSSSRGHTCCGVVKNDCLHRREGPPGANQRATYSRLRR